MSLLKILEKHRDSILKLELAALLHDADKATYKWFAENPARHDLKEEYRLAKDITESVKEIKEKRWEEIFPDTKTGKISFGIEQSVWVNDDDIEAVTESDLSSPFVYHHHNDKGDFPFISLVVHGGGCGADGIDTELDKVGGKDQYSENEKERELRIDTPFGIHHRFIPPRCPEGENVRELQQIFPKGEEVEVYVDDFKRMSDAWLGAQRYPCNDVTLWAHSYSVATLAKATLAKILIEYSHLDGAGKIDATENRYLLPARTAGKGKNATDFTFLRIVLDRDYLLSRAQRTLDVFAATDAIETVQKKLRSFVSSELLIGNETYHDEEMQLFCVPKLATWPNKKDEFGDLHERFEREVIDECRRKVAELLGEEDIAVPELPFEISFHTEDGNSGDEVSKRILDRSNMLMEKAFSCRQSAQALAEINPGTDTGKGRCEICGLRYNSDKKPQREAGKPGDTLCTVCTTRRATAGEKRNKDFKTKSWFTSDLSNCRCKRSDNTTDNKLVLVSVRFDLSSIRSGGIFDTTTVKMNSDELKKNPSPGRLYRCWETLREYTGSLFEPVTDTEGKGDTRTPVFKLNRDQPVFPVITHSPKSLQFVASACSAGRIVEWLYREYEKRFGKFRAVLPMSIGCVFFHDKFPLYVVLEAAKLLRGPLGVSDVAVHNETEVWSVSDVPQSTRAQDTGRTIELTPASCGAFGHAAGSVEWKIPRLLSREKRGVDPFHPRFKLSNKTVKHVDDLAENDLVLVRDGRFDFIFLDSAVRRFDIVPEGVRNHAYGMRPSYPLSSWRNFEQLRELLSRLSDTQVKHIESALTGKMHAWRRQWRPECDLKPWENPVIRRFCESVLFAPNAFGAKRFRDETNPAKLQDADRDLLTTAAINGMLLDAIDMYVRLIGDLARPDIKQSQQADNENTSKPEETSYE